MITATESAVEEINRIIKEKELPQNTALRIAVKGGGCAGFNYVLDFDSEVRQFDEQYEAHGLKILVDRKSLIYINGTELDFDKSITNRGFKFNNPKATAACGCGTSFSPNVKPLQ